MIELGRDDLIPACLWRVYPVSDEVMEFMCYEYGVWWEWGRHTFHLCH